MNNIFKKNSRFAALADEPNETKKKEIKKDIKKDTNKNEIVEIKNEGNSFKNEGNSFKNEGNSFKNEGNYNRYPSRDYRDNNQRNYYSNKFSKEQLERINREEQLRKEEEEKLKAEKFAKDMAPENFPVLAKSKIENKTQNSYISFSDKLKTEVEEKNSTEDELEDIDYKNLKPGWILIKKDPLTKKIITKYKESLQPPPREKTEKECALDALNALVTLHEKRTNEYIEIFGYDTWEKMFRFPDYDYDYFDRLDEEYEEEMARLEEEENNEYDSDFTNDKHYNY